MGRNINHSIFQVLLNFFLHLAYPCWLCSSLWISIKTVSTIYFYFLNYHTIFYALELLPLFVKGDQSSNPVVLTFFHLGNHSSSCVKTFICQLVFLLWFSGWFAGTWEAFFITYIINETKIIDILFPISKESHICLLLKIRRKVENLFLLDT